MNKILPSLIIFLFLYILSFIIVMNMDDWFMVWFGLELNMLSFLVLIYDYKSLWNIESCMKYFFIQSLGSVILIGGYYLGEGYFEVVCSLVLGYKMGGGPFFFWFPSVCSGISWLSCYMLMTFQKFLPMVLMMMMMGWWVWFLIIVSLIIGMVGSFNQSNLKLLLAFSSIHQIGWLLMCSYEGGLVWVIYYVIYLYVLLIVIVKVLKYQIVNLLKVVEMNEKLWMILVMVNLGGMPPLLGFFMKWYGLYNFLVLNYFFIILMVGISVIMLYIYVRVCYSMIVGENMNVGWFYKSEFMSSGNYMMGLLDISMLMGVFLGGFILFLFF